MSADPILFHDGPLAGVVWQHTSNDHAVHVMHDGVEITYEDTGRKTEGGERVYEWDDR